MQEDWPGRIITGCPIDAEVLEQYGEIVSIPLEEMWRRDGTVMTADGFMRVIDPALLMPVMDGILPSHAGGLPVMATAFGDVFVQMPDDSVDLVLYRLGFFRSFLKLSSVLLLDEVTSPATQAGALQRTIYDEAVAAYGVPEIDECFGFVLPLSMGGSPTVENVARRKLKEHLLFLVQAGGVPQDLDVLDPPRRS